MDISVVILSWNSEQYIRKCLDSLIVELNDNQYSFEIFIVDNGSIDGTGRILKSFFLHYPDFIIPIWLQTNRGTTVPRNMALKIVKGKFIVIMDSDVEVLPGAIKQLVDTLRHNSEAGIVAPKLHYPDGTLQKSTDIFPTFFTKIFRYFFLKRIEKTENLLPLNRALI